MYFGCFYFGGELGFLNCDDICMCVVNKQLAFVLDSVYVNLQYDDSSLNCWVCVLVWCLWSFCRLWSVCDVVLVPYVDVVVPVTVMRGLLFVLHVCILRGCDGARVTAMLVWGMEKVWLW